MNKRITSKQKKLKQMCIVKDSSKSRNLIVKKNAKKRV
jgi:hypothetical protein